MRQSGRRRLGSKRAPSEAPALGVRALGGALGLTGAAGGVGGGWGWEGRVVQGMRKGMTQRETPWREWGTFLLGNPVHSLGPC